MIEIHGQSVTLRDITSSDTAAVQAIVGDPAVTTWLSFDARGTDETMAMVDGIVRRQAQEPRSEYYLAICTQQTELVGFCRLGLSGVQAGKLGYAIRADQWGHGYATEAVRIMLDFGFHQLELHRISAAIGPNNAASIAVAHHLGFRHEGCLRDHVHTNGAWRDSLLYSLLAHEWADTTPDAHLHLSA